MCWDILGCVVECYSVLVCMEVYVCWGMLGGGLGALELLVLCCIVVGWYVFLCFYVFMFLCHMVFC